MKVTINCACLALFLIAFTSPAYADILDYSDMNTHRTTNMAGQVSESDFTVPDKARVGNAYNQDAPIENMISLNEDGSLEFLLDVTRSYIYSIHDDVRSNRRAGAPVPEPGTMMLLGFGIMSSSMFFRKHNKR
jgi:hypothetical protein